MKEPLLELRSSGSIKAAKYDKWLAERHKPIVNPSAKTKAVQQGLLVVDPVPKPQAEQTRNISTNQYDSIPYFWRTPVVLDPNGNTFNGRCFDVNFYRAANVELSMYLDRYLFDHFARHGQFEGRPYRLLPHACVRSSE